jgi:hypothetical protein
LNLSILVFGMLSKLIGGGIATYILLWPEDGRVQKEDTRRIYDGSLFFDVVVRQENRLL